MKWHYDISFWPHTNYSPLTVGTYLYDCGMDQGPLAVLPRSHLIEPMLSQYDDDGKWIGCLVGRRPRAARPAQGAVPGRAGRLAHAAQLPHAARLAEEHSDLGRPLLLYTLSSADAFPYTVNPIRSSQTSRSCAASAR